jgi:hypothetical protein
MLKFARHILKEGFQDAQVVKIIGHTLLSFLTMLVTIIAWLLITALLQL